MRLLHDSPANLKTTRISTLSPHITAGENTQREKIFILSVTGRQAKSCVHSDHEYNRITHEVVSSWEGQILPCQILMRK